MGFGSSLYLDNVLFLMEFTTLRYLPLPHSLQYSLSFESEIGQTMWANLAPVFNKYPAVLEQMTSSLSVALFWSWWQLAEEFLTWGPVQSPLSKREILARMKNHISFIKTSCINYTTWVTACKAQPSADLPFTLPKFTSCVMPTF